MKQLGFAVVAVMSLLGSTAGAQSRQACSGVQLGTWALKSYSSDVIGTGEKRYPLGEHATGFITYGADCRMQAVLVRGERPAPTDLVPSDAERLRLYDGLMAYGGSYRVQGNTVTHRVDISWNQSWTGTTQTRFLKVEGNTLTITTAPLKSPFDGRDSVGTLVWTKVQ